MNLRMGHFWPKALFEKPESAHTLMTIPKVIIDAEFVDEPQELNESDIEVLEYVYEETGVDFTGVKFQNEGRHAPRMASNKRTRAKRSLAPRSQP